MTLTLLFLLSAPMWVPPHLFQVGQGPSSETGINQGLIYVRPSRAAAFWSIR
jgi:hypothetical protein